MEKIKEFLTKSLYKKFKVWHLLILILIIGGNSDDNSSSSTSITGADTNAGDILVGYDWVYPDMNNPISAWKFSSDTGQESSLGVQLLPSCRPRFPQAPRLPRTPPPRLSSSCPIRTSGCPWGLPTRCSLWKSTGLLYAHSNRS